MTASAANAATPNKKPTGRHVRATEVLPPELIAQIQTHVTGKYLWVPSTIVEDRADRRRTVISLRASGMTGDRIARKLNLTPRRIWQILHDAGMTGQPTAAPTDEAA